MTDEDKADATPDNSLSGVWSAAADAESDVDSSVRTWLQDWSSPSSRAASIASRPPSIAPGQVDKSEPWSSSKMSSMSVTSAASFDTWKDTILSGIHPLWNPQHGFPSPPDRGNNDDDAALHSSIGEGGSQRAKRQLLADDSMQRVSFLSMRLVSSSNI